MRTLDERISEFARKVQPVYELLDWEWGSGSTAHIPSVEEIRDTLHHLADLCVANGGTYVATGGLKVEVEWEDFDDGEQGQLGIFFEMSDFNYMGTPFVRVLQLGNSKDY